jgi:hypothetical protein
MEDKMLLAVSLFLIFIGVSLVWHKWRFLWNRNHEPEIFEPDAAITSLAFGGSPQNAAASGLLAGIFGYITGPLFVVIGILGIIVATCGV